MPPEESPNKKSQADLFRSELEQIIDLNHGLVKLSKQIDWEELDQTFTPLFCEDNGRAACSSRLMVGLHYLKHTYDLSDEGTLEQWLQNPYWQYFCGMKHFEHRLPIHYSSMSRWRQKIQEVGAEKMLAELIKVGLRSKMIGLKQLERVNVDTTVQEKHIRFPTDGRLYDRMRERLVKQSQKEGVGLRQSYRYVGPKILMRQSRYAQVQQFKRAAKMTGKLKTLLGRVVRDIRGKTVEPSSNLKSLLKLADRLLVQKREDSDKLYSVHEPHVECICKGKVHKRYEFGCKVSLATTSKGNWIVAASALHGNPYDGHTLEQTIQKMEHLCCRKPKMIFCDLGYRGTSPIKDSQIYVVPRKRRHLSGSLRHWMNRRAAIEPIFGHLKAEHRLDRNRLKGKLGDQMNALLSACGWNFRKLLKAFFSQNYLSLFLRLLWLKPTPSSH